MVAVLRGCRSFCTAATDIPRVKITGVNEKYLERQNFVDTSSANDSTEPLPLTVFVHPHVETLLEPAGLALVPVRLVNGAGAVTSLAPAHSQ